MADEVSNLLAGELNEPRTGSLFSFTNSCSRPGRRTLPLESNPVHRHIPFVAHAAEIQVPDDLAALRLPRGVDRRLHVLLDKQDEGIPLTEDERAEAEGLVELSEMLSLLKLRSRRS